MAGVVPLDTVDFANKISDPDPEEKK
jgi:hypothetical protein